MSTTDTEVQSLVINVGTKQQIDDAISGGTITQNMLSVTTDEDDCASVNMNNLTSAGKKIIAELSKPETNYTNLTVGASESTYTATNNGYVTAGAYNANNATATLRLENMSCGLNTNSNAGAGDWGCYCILPVRKGQTYKLMYSNITNWVFFRFIKAYGDV